MWTQILRMLIYVLFGILRETSHMRHIEPLQRVDVDDDDSSHHNDDTNNRKKSN